jgi:cold shock CspA family protein
VVRSWDLERMHGVIDGDEVPGGCLVRFAAVAVDGFPALRPGDRVEFEWRQLDEPQSGYLYECARAWPVGQQPVARRGRPFRAGLWRMHPDGTAEKVTIEASEQPRPTPGGQTTGTVRIWSDEQGWGVIDSPQTRGRINHGRAGSRSGSIRAW